MNNEMKLLVKLIGLRAPRDWEMEGNKGTTYKVSVGFEGKDGVDTVALKVDQETYHEIKSLNLPFGADLVVTFGPRVVIRDNQQQLIIAATGFALPEQAKKSA